MKTLLVLSFLFAFLAVDVNPAVSQLNKAASTVKAQSKKIQIRQIDLAQHTVVFQARGVTVRPGQSLIVTSRDGAQCSLVVQSLKDNLALADSRSCAFAPSLRVGQIAELSLAEARDGRAAGDAFHSSGSPQYGSPGLSSTMSRLKEVVPAGELTGLAAFGFYDMTDSFKGDISANGASAASTSNSETAFGLGVEYAQYSVQSFGYYIDGAYEFGRDLKSINVNNQTINYNPKPSVAFFLIGAGANFAISENFYGFGGANYNFPSVTNGGNLKSVDGKLGFEGGVGARLAGQFTIQGLYRKLNMTGTGNGFSLDNLSASGAMLRGGYMF